MKSAQYIGTVAESVTQSLLLEVGIQNELSVYVTELNSSDIAVDC